MGQLNYPAMLAEFYDQSDVSDVFEFHSAEDRMLHIQHHFLEQRKPQVMFKSVRTGTPTPPRTKRLAQSAPHNAFRHLS